MALCEKINLATSSYESDEKLPLWISQYNQQLEGHKYIPAKTYNGTSWTLAVTKTDENGYYEFKGFIPGDYYVIFGYGYSDETLLPKNSETTNIMENLARIINHIMDKIINLPYLKMALILRTIVGEMI